MERELASATGRLASAEEGREAISARCERERERDSLCLRFRCHPAKRLTPLLTVPLPSCQRLMPLLGVLLPFRQRLTPLLGVLLQVRPARAANPRAGGRGAPSSALGPGGVTTFNSTALGHSGCDRRLFHPAHYTRRAADTALVFSWRRRRTRHRGRTRWPWPRRRSWPAGWRAALGLTSPGGPRPPLYSCRPIKQSTHRRAPLQL